ncbi:TMV resistance protein N-like [Eucalyptus grandis]|uniref:TMV resistance protein N-like n=1 Tax=Eucalyptus grandis TaxID=71139 RepID=UPI00192EBC01|nr:TMV resistance protein N-like [Eucalyptus grandis]
MDKEQSQRKRAEEESTRGVSSSSSISSEATGVDSSQYDVFLSFRGSDIRNSFIDHLYHNLIKAGTVPICVFRDDNNNLIGEEFGLEILNAITRSKISIPVISENYALSKWHEGKLIERVVEIVISKLREDFLLDVPQRLVGFDGHVKKIMSWINEPFINARMIGICGMGRRIGKTTLAKCIYNQLLNKFVHVSFLPNVRESTRRHGIAYLQSQLITDILHIKSQVYRIDDGINIIKSRFKGKKVLILLDDIDDKNQLDALAGERNWFMAGSMIIVTTRNEAVLHKSEFEVDHKYELNGLDEAHSLLLFNRHAFRMNDSPSNFKEISRDDIATMGGLPLAIEVVGSYLYKITNLRIWEDTLQKLREGLHKDVQKILRIGNDAIVHRYRKIFLDIACFLVGEKSKFAIYMWEDWGFPASQRIKEMELNGLIKFGEYGELKMDGALIDLGRDIVRQERLLERRSRLWVYEEALRVIMEEKGTNGIQAICLDKYYGQPLRPLGHAQTYTDKQFKHLRSLRFLQLRAAALSGDFDKLFSDLRWLQWFDIEPNLCILAINLHLPKLVVLQLSYNHITEHWGGWDSIMAAKRLKVLDLAFCNYLRCTPDLSAFTLLEILILKHCDGMEQLDPSIGRVNSLVSLDLSDCSSLKEISTSIGSLRKLEKLSAKGCRSLREIPNSIGDLQNLRHLDISEFAIEKLPNIIGRLTNLQTLSLESCQSLKGEIPSEIEIQGHDFLNILEEIVIDCCKSIERLILPELRCLKQLKANYCHNLVEIQGLDRVKSLEVLDISNCGSIERLPDLPCFLTLKELNINDCHNLRSVESLERLLSCRSIYRNYQTCRNLKS